MAKSTAHEMVYRILEALIIIRKKFIKWPNLEKARKTSNHFRENNGFPNIIGIIDGSHIPIAKPTINQESYINRKGYHSLILQGVCDEKKRFIDVSCGMYLSTKSLLIGCD